MKKFLVFLVALVVVVCAGLTTYYFVRNNEIITIKTKEIYCNAGDVIPLNSLGIEIKKANISKKTTFDYNAGGEDVTKYIEYDAESETFVVSTTNAGEVSLVIRTSNKKYADFIINVHIGNGSLQNPYFIFNETELMRIGSTYRLDSHYILMNNITLTSSFRPIGYNSNTQTWDTFNGTFNGQRHTISGMNLENSTTPNAGFFTRLGANAIVKDLTITNSKIAGSHETAGIVAGKSEGRIERVAVVNATINNAKDNSVNGAFIGCQSNNTIKMCYADNIEINLGNESSALTKATIGGFAGKLSKAGVQASYANNINLTANSANLVAGGFVGTFEIDTNSGTIQQSYANTTCTNNNFGAFIGTITKTSGFDATKANMLKYLIGNFAVVYGKADSNAIVDTDLVKSFDNTFFKNKLDATASVFFNKDASLYLVRGFAGVNDVINTNEFVFYAIDSTKVTNWDTTYVWDASQNALPVLKMGEVYPVEPTSEYFTKDLEEVEVPKESFEDKLDKDIKDTNFKLTGDVELSADWTPINIQNATFDGNNKTIKINLKNAKSGNLGLFGVVDNATIKNLTIIVTGVSGNASYGGALAGIIKSTDGASVSSINNVKITFEDNFKTPTISYFGGIAGSVENALITNCQVKNLTINSSAVIETAGSLFGEIKAGASVRNTQMQNITIYASKNVGGIAGTNAGNILQASGNSVVNYNKNSNGASIGGVVGVNNGLIDGCNIFSDVTVSNFGENVNVGGVAGINNGTISNHLKMGNKISITATSTSKLLVGGIAGTNDGTIENSNVEIGEIGTYSAGKSHYVGGVASVNNGTIKKVLAQANVNGNYTAGIVVTMNHSSAVVDQVMVARYDNMFGSISKNTIKGDKYVAGAVVDFKSGKMTNLQLVSTISGESNNARISLITLIFPYGANMNAVTVDSGFTGYGTKYRETWTDFASYTNKAEFGLANGETGDSRFNLYKYDNHHGVMQNVVINTGNSGVSDANAAMGQAFAWGKDYQDTSESSYIKTVSAFNDVTQFQGSFTFVCAKSTMLGIEHQATKTLNFTIGTIWKSQSGIRLSFITGLRFVGG